MKSAIRKLSPEQLKVSGKMTAILGYLVGRKWTNPSIAEMAVTSDGFLMARSAGDVGMNDFLGEESNLLHNLDGIADVVGFTLDERAWLQTRVNKRIAGWGHKRR